MVHNGENALRENALRENALRQAPKIITVQHGPGHCASKFRI
jgi:hypothetical protein